MSEETDMTGDGDCFEVAGRMALDRAMSKEHDPSFRVCHGQPTGTGKLAGQVFHHAWVEIGDIVIDQSNGRNYVGRREDYYRAGNITQVSRYTAHEARALMLQTEHFGPWPVAD